MSSGYQLRAGNARVVIVGKGEEKERQLRGIGVRQEECEA